MGASIEMSRKELGWNIKTKLTEWHCGRTINLLDCDL